MQNSPKDVRKKLLGRKGEDKTVGYLKRRGYKILERNFKTPFGEADIIAFKKGVVCFVEVKTRSGEDYLPEEAVDERKRERYRQIAWYYCKTQGKELNCRFDVSAVSPEGIRYYEDAYGS